MENIVEFPAEDVRNWAAISRILRQNMENEGVHQSKIDWILNDFKPRLDYILHGQEPMDQNARFFFQIMQLEAQLFHALFG